MRLLLLFTLGGTSGKGDASDEDDENEFFDAMEDPAEFITVPADPKYHRLMTVFLFKFILLLFLSLFLLSLSVFCFSIKSCSSVLQEIWQQR